MPRRINIVVTRNKKFVEYVKINPSISLRTNRLVDTFVANSFEKALEIAQEKEDVLAKEAGQQGEVFIAGGAQIFAQGIKYADKLYLTIVKGNFEGDTFFPDYSEFKKVVYKKESQGKNYRYTFLELER